MSNATKQCPRCDDGKMYFYSKACIRCHSAAAGWAIWSPEDIAFLDAHYPNNGAAWVAERIDKTHGQIISKANRLKIGLTKKATRRIVHDKAAQHMRADNPSRRPGASERMSVAAAGRKDVLAKLFAGHAKLQRDKPSKLELRACAILDSLGVAYEAHVIIKTNFVIDIKIDGLIIECDGDWWHGHPRYGRLTERQVAQQRRDAARNKYLTTCGYRVVRIWESDMGLDVMRRVLEENGIPFCDQIFCFDPAPTGEERVAPGAVDRPTAGLNPEEGLSGDAPEQIDHPTKARPRKDPVSYLNGLDWA